MHIIAIDALAGLRTTLTAPADERAAAFDAHVMQPLRPIWEGWTRFRPPSKGAAEPTPLDLARGWAFYHPELDASRGLAALDVLDAAAAADACRRALDDAAARLDPSAHGVDLDAVRWALVLGDPDALDPKTDQFTGVGMVPGSVLVLAWPTAFNVPRLPAIAVHELNHNVRFRVEPWSPATTVGKYLVDEGVAECFAAELVGEAMLGRWTTALDDATLDALRPRYRDAIDVTGFDEIRGWMFGDWSAERAGHARVGVPDFAGYALGYRLVRAFLDRTGLSAAEATYLPWREIVEESGYL